MENTQKLLGSKYGLRYARIKAITKSTLSTNMVFFINFTPIFYWLDRGFLFQHPSDYRILLF